MKSITIFSAFLTALIILHPGPTAAGEPPRAKIPVILDTDIGDDIDDTWALGLLLKSPELELKLVVGDQGKAQYRARLLAKFLERAGRTDVPVGIGLEINAKGEGAQAEWIKGYDLKSYPGKVHPDGVRAMIDLIMQSPEPVTVIAIGPLPNLAAALEREPKIAAKARLVGMHGSVRVGYDGSPNVAAEYNVKEDAKACQKALSAAWDITITPLDTCGLVSLKGEAYQQVRDAQNPVAVAIMENYRVWLAAQRSNPNTAQTHSSTLFDTVAVYLAFSQRWLKMEDLGIRVDNAGFTRMDPGAKVMHTATSWLDQTAYEKFLANRLAEFR